VPNAGDDGISITLEWALQDYLDAHPGTSWSQAVEELRWQKIRTVPAR
jgi:hypothetical protein